MHAASTCSLRREISTAWRRDSRRKIGGRVAEREGFYGEAFLAVGARVLGEIGRWGKAPCAGRVPAPGLKTAPTGGAHLSARGRGGGIPFRVRPKLG
jgi:hypothetical protein